jgi:hypothetical protein
LNRNILAAENLRPRSQGLHDQNAQQIWKSRRYTRDGYEVSASISGEQLEADSAEYATLKARHLDSKDN